MAKFTRVLQDMLTAELGQDGYPNGIVFGLNQPFMISNDRSLSERDGWRPFSGTLTSANGQLGVTHLGPSTTSVRDQNGKIAYSTERFCFLAPGAPYEIVPIEGYLKDHPTGPEQVEVWKAAMSKADTERSPVLCTVRGVGKDTKLHFHHPLSNSDDSPEWPKFSGDANASVSVLEYKLDDDTKAAFDKILSAGSE